MSAKIGYLASKQDEAVRAIVRSAEQYEIEDSSEWPKLAELSSNTHVDGLEVDPAGIVVQKDGRFEGLMTVYVVLEYGGGKEKDGVTTSDAFNAKFVGRIGKEKGKSKREVVIEDVQIDTSPFYA